MPEATPVATWSLPKVCPEAYWIPQGHTATLAATAGRMTRQWLGVAGVMDESNRRAHLVARHFGRPRNEAPSRYASQAADRRSGRPRGGERVMQVRAFFSQMPPSPPDGAEPVLRESFITTRNRGEVIE